MKKIQITEDQYKKIKNHMIENAILQEQDTSQVVDIQTRLNNCFNAGLDVDGISGPRTKAAIERYTGLKI